MVAANETVVDVAVVPSEQKPELTIEEKTSTMKDAFAAGKRDYISGEFDTAADKLGQAASLSVEIYGEFAVESFDAHLYYGKALLELGRAEEDVIKTAMKDMPLPDENNESIDEEKYGNPDTLTETEREEIKDKVEEALAENAEELEAKSAESEDPKSTSDEKMIEGDVAEAQEQKSDVVEKNTGEEVAEADPASNKDEKEISDVEVPVVPESATTVVAESSEEAATASSETTAVVETTTPAAEEPMEQSAEENNEDVADEENGADDGQESEGDDGSEAPEEPSSIQAAWEVLEVARSICDKRDSCKEWDLKKADVLLTLGECSIEDENYKQAVDDITMCIELYKKHMDACDRVIAQAFVTMARAYKLHDDFANAGVYYTKAKETLLAKIEALTAKFEGASEEEKAVMQKELDELKELVPDLDLKIEDSADSAKQTEENMDKIRQQMGLSTAPVLAEKTDAPAQDISSLVRKPAKRVAETVEEEDDAKRVKADTDTSSTAAV